MAGQLNVPLARHRIQVRKRGSGDWEATAPGRNLSVNALSFDEARDTMAEAIAVSVGNEIDDVARDSRGTPIWTVDPDEESGSDVSNFHVTIFTPEHIRWDFSRWDDSTEARLGLSSTALPLWLAGREGVPLSDAAELSRFCAGEPSLQKRLAETRRYIDVRQPKIGSGGDDNRRLKAATLLFLELYEPDAEGSATYRQRPGVSVRTAAERVLASGHQAAKSYNSARSIANLHRDRELMKMAALNSRVW